MMQSPNLGIGDRWDKQEVVDRLGELILSVENWEKEVRQAQDQSLYRDFGPHLAEADMHDPARLAVSRAYVELNGSINDHVSRFPKLAKDLKTYRDLLIRVWEMAPDGEEVDGLKQTSVPWDSTLTIRSGRSTGG